MLKTQQILPKLSRCLLYVVAHNLESQNAVLIDARKGAFTTIYVSIGHVCPRLAPLVRLHLH